MHPSNSVGYGQASIEVYRQRDPSEEVDALCAAPVYQMKEVYRYGNVDDCTGHWGELYQCLKLRTKFAHQVRGLCHEISQAV